MGGQVKIAQLFKRQTGEYLSYWFLDPGQDQLLTVILKTLVDLQQTLVGITQMCRLFAALATLRPTDPR